MITITAEIENKVRKLLVILTTDAEYTEQSIIWLSEMRAMVLRRDEKGLNDLFERIRQHSEVYAQSKNQREQLRREISIMLDCQEADVRLSRLEKLTSAGLSLEISALRERLQASVAKLQKEHMATASQMSELARFNRVLLNTILESGKTAEVTYSSSGTKKRQGNNTFVNLRL